VSKCTDTYLEINASPLRLDLNDASADLAFKAGCKLAIDTDAHNREELRNMKLGIAVARRAWAEKKSIINTQPLRELQKTLRRN
jgi:DNA polymerase (family 10)